MVRSRTQIGTNGNVTVTPYAQDPATGRRTRLTTPQSRRADAWKAHTRYRDDDGVTRLVERWATTKAKAENALKAALVDRQTPHRAGDWTPDLELQAASHLWLAQVDRSRRSPSTKTQYRRNRDRYLTNESGEERRRKVCTKSRCCGSIRRLTLREVNRVGTIERYLQGIADNHGPGAAKTTRTVLSGILSEAVRQGVLPHNACRDVRPATPITPKPSLNDIDRAFTRGEREVVLAIADRDDGASDTSDLIHFLAGTGCRIGEALHCVDWADVDLDDPRGPRVHVRGTKTDNADRVLPLPPWLAERLRCRGHRFGTRGLVFGVTRYPSKLGQPRDKRNVTRTITSRMTTAGMPWATSHTFRRTVATWMDEAGAPLAEIANQLGHANVSVTASYLGRRVAPSRAADIL